MDNVVSINEGKELISRYKNANRFSRLARELERDIKILRGFQMNCIVNDIESRHLEGQIQIYTETMNNCKERAKLAGAES